MHNFSLLITDWYRQNKRSLPWRDTNDPYLIWLSEIILQQTRVDQGLSYFEKFRTHYPTVIHLADADEKDVLNDWQGLGYYSRARNMHFSAQLIRDEYKGFFPDSYNEILKLKGVGKYTAAAISSFAFNEKKAVVDGNVYRLLSRFFGISTPIDSSSGQKEFQQLADTLISEEHPGEHNQAIMEMGAVICTPKKPDCQVCPLMTICVAHSEKTISELPVKAKKTKVRDRFFHYMIYAQNGKTIIELRNSKDIWQSMYQFPLFESKTQDDVLLLNQIKEQVFESAEIIHKLSHQTIHAVFHHFDKFPETQQNHWIEIQTENIQEFPLPRIIDRYLENNTIEV